MLLTLSRLRYAAVASERMQRHDNRYHAALGVVGAGWWEIALRLPAGRRTQVIPFLIHYSTSWGIVAGYPLLVPVGSMHPAITLPLGHDLITVHLSIGTVGATTVTVRGSWATHLSPARLRVTFSMLDMLMPRTTATARGGATHQYAAYVFLPMPGL